MENIFLANSSVYHDQSYNAVDAAFTNGRLNYNLRYDLNWASDGTNTVNWDPDPSYNMVANSIDLNHPGIQTVVYLQGKFALIKAFRNPQGVFSITATFKSEADRATFKALIAAKIGLLEEDLTKPNVNFWYTHPTCGPRAMTKPIEVPVDDKIMFNYASSIRPELLDLVKLDPARAMGGKLILLHGIPGTGKTYFIRHLMHKWRTWCNFQYISDPENFFQNPAYLFEVTRFFDQGAIPASYASYEGYEGDTEAFNHAGTKSTLVVLEDAGEFIESNSNNEFVAKSLNKLLNVTDGLLGQGLKLLILITTNQEAKGLDPAILRSGRCLKNIEFPELSGLDVLEWYKKNDLVYPSLDTDAKLLADLYSLKENK